jgi:nucleotide sugar dehydrogenase
VVGGFDADSARDAGEFWRRALGVEVIEVGSLTAAEITKLASNWWIDHNIALANELAKFCALYGVDSLDVIAAANTIPKGRGNVNILLPSVGVGGSCLTKDPWMVWHAARERGLDILTAPAGREVNDSMPEYTAQLAVDQLTKLGKDPAASKIAVLGLTFKNDTGDLRSTPTEHAIAALRRGCAEVSLFDPLVDREEGERLFGVPLAASVEEAVRDADCVAVFALHQELTGIDFGALPVAEGCLILDGRAYYPAEKIASLRALGYHYCGVGR